MLKKKSYLYVAPAVLLTLLFYVVPFVYLAAVSFFRWDGLGPMEYVGTGNFTYLLSSKVFGTAMKNTLIWIASAILLHVPLGLILALVISKKPKGYKLFRIVYFLPNVISVTAIAFLWYFIFHPDIGMLNNILVNIGLGDLTRAWLSRPDTALYATMTPFVLYVGLTMIIFSTQLSTIPAEYYEAASIDGATSLQQDLHISLPMLRNSIGINILLNAAFCLKMMEYPFLMTGGGPADTSNNLSLFIYREMITANNYGISMAAGLITVLVGSAILAGISRITAEKE